MRGPSKYSTSNYLTQIVPERLNLIPVNQFINNWPQTGFGYVANEGYIDDEYEILPESTMQDIPQDATHVLWFNSADDAKTAWKNQWVDPFGPPPRDEMP